MIAAAIYSVCVCVLVPVCAEYRGSDDIIVVLQLPLNGSDGSGRGFDVQYQVPTHTHRERGGAGL